MIQRTEAEIKKNWNTAHPILVSIICFSYNHKDFLEQAIDSFLMQETTFPFEIIIQDDASTDGSADIIKKYHALYPTLIKPILQTQNQYSKTGSFFSILKLGLQMAQGKYIAYCDGDDYWTDRKKLEIQVNFLENHPEFIMCAHAVEVENLTASPLPSPYRPVVKPIHTFKDILSNHFIPTLSLVFRYTRFEPEPAFLHQVRSLDMAIELMLSSQGLCYYFPRKMGCYRQHSAGISQQNLSPLDRRNLYYLLYQGIDSYTEFKYTTLIQKKLGIIDYSISRIYLKNKNYKQAFSLFLSALKKDAFFVFRLCYKKIVFIA